MATMLLAAAFRLLGELFGELAQPFLAVSRVQWVGIFVLTCVCSARRRGLQYVLFVICLEVIQGFTGFFSDFKEVFIVVLLGILATRPKLDVRTVTVGLMVCSVVVALGVFWSAIKMDYRAFVSEGSTDQIVSVSFSERLSYLADRVVDVDEDKISRGLDALVQRLGYVDFLSAAMRNVPARLPFQDGAQIGATIMHVLQPRFIFPDKPPLMSDTDVTQKFTGLRWTASTSGGTSISLGYLAELYIDFGILGTIATMFIFGVLLGRIFEAIYSSRSLPSIVNFGLAVMLAMTVMQFEQALAKSVGAFVTTFIAVGILRRFVLPPLLRMVSQNTVQQSVERSRLCL